MLVDSNVLIDVLADDPQWADWSANQLRRQSQIHRLVINPIVYSEVSVAFDSVEALEAVFDRMDIPLVQVPKPALFLAGKAFMAYRKERGTKTGVLGDFFIGAHAAVAGLPVLTRDARRYRRYFPSVQIVAP
jgi:predicted nucleic acid-binding protein